METSLQKIKQFDEKSNQITEIINEVMTGNIEPLPVYLYLKKIEKTVKDSLSLIQDATVEQGARFGQGEHLQDSVYFQIKSAPGKYVYSEWVAEAENEFKRRKELEQQAFKLSKHGQTVVNEDGEIVGPAHYYDGKQTIAVTIPKIK